MASLSTNLGGGATTENPGNVHPTSDPSTGHYPPSTAEGQKGPSIFNAIENPYMLRESINKLESALDDIIGLFGKEGETLSKDGDFTEGKQACVASMGNEASRKKRVVGMTR